MRNRMILLSVLMMMSAVPAWCADLRINGKPVENNSAVSVAKDDLVGGKIEFVLRSEENVVSAEVSVDAGRSWATMSVQASGIDQGFSWDYRPMSEGILNISFMLKDDKGGMRVYDPHIKIDYVNKKPLDAVKVLLERIKAAYQDERKDQFLALLTGSFPDRIKFEESIQNDFLQYNNIRLKYRIERLVFSNDNNSAIADIYWEKKYESASGAPATVSATIGMQLEKSSVNWQVSGMRGNTVFGSSLLNSGDLSITAADLHTRDIYTGCDIYVTVHNNSDNDLTDVKVKIYEKFGSAPGTGDVLATATIASISAHGEANTAAYTYPNQGMGAAYYFKAVVDPDNLIEETNEGNNEASKTGA
jgi:hypothetical protein